MACLRVVRLALAIALVFSLAHSVRGRAKCSTSDAVYVLELVRADDEGWDSEAQLQTHVAGITLFSYSSVDSWRELEADRE